MKETIVIVSADHGGAGRTHGHANFDDTRSRRTPWLINGPDMRKSF